MFDLGRTFLQSVERSPNALAIVADQVRLTYSEWFEKIKAVAGGLEQAGLKSGDSIAIVCQNHWEMATIHWASQFLGLMITPLNWRSKADELDYCLTDSQAKLVIYDVSSAAEVRASDVALHLPRIYIGADSAVGESRFTDLLQAMPMDGVPRATENSYSLMLYTSGTTGKPKGVPRRHRHERAAALAHVAQNLYGRGEVTLGVMPLYHTMGVRSLLAMALIDGCFVCLPRFDVGTALQLIEQEKINNLYLVPTLYHDLIAHPDFCKTNISSVTKLGFAGASMPESLLRRLDEVFKPKLFVNHYGSSEVYTMSISQDARLKAGSSGRAGMNCRLRIIKLNSMNPEDVVEPMEEGQIIADLNGDEAFEGYWNRPDADAKSLHQGWYLTGDTGYFDHDGDLFVSGRVDDMIISGGENISPLEIESLLSLHPAVDEVAVVGLKDERWGQRVVAFIKKKAEVTSEELDLYCRSTDLANYKRPREYVCIRDIPKSPVGKILRRKLVAGEYELDSTFGSAIEIN